MHGNETNPKGSGPGCAGFESIFKGCEGMFCGMDKRGTDRGGEADCSAAMEAMMKAMMEMCCGRKAGHDKQGSTKGAGSMGDIA